MITTEYAFFAPKTLDEALGLLTEDHGDLKVLAGGMSLVPTMTLGLAQPEVVVSLNHLPGLDFVESDKNKIRIGALTRHATVCGHPVLREHLPVLAQAAKCIGDVQVRHRGTIGGSLAHADPAADYPIVMLAVGAEFRLQSRKGERAVKAADFFLGLMQTALRPDELLTEIHVPKLPAGSGSSYQRLHRVEGNFAIVAAAAVVEKGLKKARVALGGVGPRPALVDVSKRLAGGASEQAYEEVAKDVWAASADAFGDLNGDAGYRRAMAQVYAKRTLQAAISQVK